MSVVMLSSQFPLNGTKCNLLFFSFTSQTSLLFFLFTSPTIVPRLALPSSTTTKSFFRAVCNLSSGIYIFSLLYLIYFLPFELPSNVAIIWSFVINEYFCIEFRNIFFEWIKFSNVISNSCNFSWVLISSFSIK